MHWTIDELHALDRDVYDVLVEELAKPHAPSDDIDT